MRNDNSFKLFLFIIVTFLVVICTKNTYAYLISFEDYNSIKSTDLYAVKSEFVLNKDIIKEGYHESFEFSVCGEVDTSVYAYTLYWIINYNNMGEKFKYTINGVSLKDGKELSESENNKVINTYYVSSVPSVSNSIGSGIISTGVVHKYTLNVYNFGHSIDGKAFDGSIIIK